MVSKQDAIEILHEIFRALRRGRGTLNRRLKRAVWKTYREYAQMQAHRHRVETKQIFKAGLPIEFSANIGLGSLSLDSPIQYERETLQSVEPSQVDDNARGEELLSA